MFNKFVNIHTLSLKEIEHLENSFLEKVKEVLLPLECDLRYINSIGMSLFKSMSSGLVFYHTPVHIMSIFDFAVENNISLSPTQELSILFHDAIYRPRSKINESLSVKFMESLLQETGVPEKEIITAGHIIDATSRHLQDDEEEHKLVMDLDMSGFVSTPGQFTFQSEMIEKEFYNGNNDLYTLEQFLTGRLGFLTKLQQKKSIYRTPMFLKKFEKRAQLNLSNAINEVKRRIHSSS